MTTIDSFFKSKTDKLAYLELKNEREMYIDYGLTDIPLPIISDDLMTALQNRHFENEVNTKYVMEGMLFNIAVDPDFAYCIDYKNVLKNMFDHPSKYATTKGVDYLDKNPDRSLIFFRAAYLLDDKDLFAKYNYARLLWRAHVDDNEKSDFIKNSIILLEEILSADDSYSLAYYELGNIYKELGEYIKSMSYYRRALELVDPEPIKEEIRGKMKDIEPDALVEDAIHYINRMNYKKALELLFDAQKNVSRYDVLYYMAVCYMNLEDFDQAEEHFAKALKAGADFATLYIDYIFVMYSKGQVLQALELANEALEKYPADLKIRYNRALIYVEQGRIEKAIEDLDFILEYADLSDEFSGQVREIRNSLIN